MRFTFRPLPGLSIACAILFALLIGLGVWQIQRLHWKLALIASVNAHLSDSPITVDRALAMGKDAQYHRVVLTGRFANDRETYIFTTTADGAPIYHVLTPFRSDDGRTFMVDRGAVPKELLEPSSRSPITGPTRLVGIWRVPDAAGFFTPPPEPAHRLWFSRDVTAMARLDGVRLAAPVLIEADATPNPGGWPKGGQTVVTFPNNHLSYALTWFGLAGGLLGVYLAFHMSKGRLKFGS
ncbi:MAG TPA: SURF1 family protein [Rhizomicrobium sp.]